MHVQEAGDDVVSESTDYSKSQEDQMLTETNNNVLTASSSSASYSSLMSINEQKGIPSDLKPENVVGLVSEHKDEVIREDAPGQVMKEEKLLPTPDRESEFIKEEAPTENQAKITEKEMVKGIPKQIKKQEMPRNGQAKAEKELVKVLPKATNEDDKKAGEDQEKVEDSVQEPLQTPVREKEVPKNGLKQAKKKNTTANDVDKGGEDLTDVGASEKEKKLKKTLPKPKKVGRAKEVLTSTAKEVSI